MKDHMSATKVIWSEILPRQWGNNEGLESARKRMNTYAVKLVKANNGFYVKHVNLTPFNFIQYKRDGVHLSESGTQTLLGNFRFSFFSIYGW